MSTYQLYAPVGLTAENFESFQDLMEKQAAGSVSPEDVARFAERNVKDAFVQEPEPRPYLLMNKDVPGAYTRVIMWHAKGAAADDMSKRAMLFLDIVQGANGNLLQPRRFVLGSSAQCVIPYRMECCPGLSALVSYKQNGQLHAGLVENDRFTTPDHRDLFGIKSGKSNMVVDQEGSLLRHWQTHILRKVHACESLPTLGTPKRLGAFTPG